MTGRFADRASAGRALARRLASRRYAYPVVVVALPRGGVPVAAEVAHALVAPLDLVLVRKIGSPWQPELAVAAVAEGDPPVTLGDADADYIAEEALIQQRENARRRQLYLHGRPALPVRGATVIVVDDGLATGLSMRAALRSLRRRQPARLVLAVPVASPDALAALSAEADETVCLAAPASFRAVGLHYADFHQVSDEEVLALLAAAETTPPDSD